MHCGNLVHLKYLTRHASLALKWMLLRLSREMGTTSNLQKFVVALLKNHTNTPHTMLYNIIWQLNASFHSPYYRCRISPTHYLIWISSMLLQVLTMLLCPPAKSSTSRYIPKTIQVCEYALRENCFTFLESQEGGSCHTYKLPCKCWVRKFCG